MQTGFRYCSDAPPYRQVLDQLLALLASVAAYAACLRLYGGVTCNSVALKYRAAVHASMQQRGISRLRLNSNWVSVQILTRRMAEAVRHPLPSHPLPDRI